MKKKIQILETTSINVHIIGNVICGIGSISCSPWVSCAEHSCTSPSTSSTIDVEVVDPSSRCTGDIQIASVCLKEFEASTDTEGTLIVVLIVVFVLGLKFCLCIVLVVLPSLWVSTMSVL